MADVTRKCPYCGISRNMPKQHEACVTCRRYTALNPGPKHALTGGEWQNVGGIQRWVCDEPVPDFVAIKPPAKRGPKPHLDAFDWTWTDLIEARRQHAAGHRSPWAIEGNRVYKRETKRRQRATKTERKEAA